MSFEKTNAPHPDDTIVALSSATGGSLRAIVRISGPLTRSVIAAHFTSPHEAAPRTLQSGVLRLTGLHSPLPADLYFFQAPHSYTGQDLAELHTIGSPPLVDRLIADLLTAGARPANPGEFTQRAFLAGKLDLPQAEAVHAVIEAGTDAEMKRALAQLAGGITQPLESLRTDLLNLLADLEAGLDFVDEDIEFVPRSDLLRRLAHGIADLESLLGQLEDRSVSGRPFRIVLVGLPNAGKSSLFNALGTGTDAIVSPIPGTTRDYLAKRFTLDGVLVELIDTAGWQGAADTIEAQAQSLGREQAEAADLVLWCVEAGGPFEERHTFAGEVIRVRTKGDLAGDSSEEMLSTSTVLTGGTAALIGQLNERAASFARQPLAPSQSRCRHSVEACLADLRQAHAAATHDEPQELIALSLRSALSHLGETVGAIYTNDLLDRIFSRFCIGK